MTKARGSKHRGGQGNRQQRDQAASSAEFMNAVERVLTRAQTWEDEKLIKDGVGGEQLQRYLDMADRAHADA